jgi:hypothetical protein
VIDSIVAGEVGSGACVVRSVIGPTHTVEEGAEVTDARLPESAPEPA